MGLVGERERHPQRKIILFVSALSQISAVPLRVSYIVSILYFILLWAEYGVNIISGKAT